MGGAVVSQVALVIIGAFFVAMALYLFGALPGFDLIDELDLDDLITELTVLQKAVGLLFWMATDVVGLIFIYVTYRLFRGIQRHGVFTDATARRLRLMGALIFSLAPVSWISEAMGTFALTCMSNCSSEADVRVSLSLDDTDVYALVIGIVLITIGHIFVEAVRLSEENQSFV